MKVVLVAQDFAPSQALEMLARQMIKRGHEVWTFLASGKEMSVDENIKSQIDNSDVVITGMSSSPKLSAMEREAIQAAIEADVPFCCYADSFGCYNRPWFQELLPSAARLFVINEAEAKAAAELFTDSQKPEIVVSGNPTWEKFAFPELTRERVRESLGIGSSEFVIMSPGIKDLVINILLWGSIIEAVSKTDRDVRVILSLHPGDPNDLQLYQSLTKCEGVRVDIIPASKMRGSEMLPGVDLVVESFSTIGIEAAFQRIPVIGFLSKFAKDRRRQQAEENYWPPYDSGVAWVIDDGSILHLSNTISDLFYGDQVKTLQARQAEIYPMPKVMGTSVKIMADAIESINH